MFLRDLPKKNVESKTGKSTDGDKNWGRLNREKCFNAVEFKSGFSHRTGKLS